MKCGNIQSDATRSSIQHRIYVCTLNILRTNRLINKSIIQMSVKSVFLLWYAWWVISYRKYTFGFHRFLNFTSRFFLFFSWFFFFFKQCWLQVMNVFSGFILVAPLLVGFLLFFSFVAFVFRILSPILMVNVGCEWYNIQYKQQTICVAFKHSLDVKPSTWICNHYFFPNLLPLAFGD